MSKYESVLRAIGESPWAILPAKLAAIQEVMALRANGVRFTDEEIEARIGSAAARPMSASAGAVAILPVFGVLARRMDMMMEASGGTSTERLSAMVQQAVADPNVAGIVLQIDSPGGSVQGITELAAEIRAARAQKPIVAIAVDTAASAAYWLASQASEIMVTPSGQVGSIGVLTVHEDISAALEMQGVKPTIVSAGKYKVEASPFAPLSEEAKAAMQETVDAYYTMFVADVAKGRGVSVADVRNGFGQGRMIMAKDAVRMGMADSIGSLSDAITRASGAKRSRPSAQAADGYTIFAAKTDATGFDGDSTDNTPSIVEKDEVQTPEVEATPPEAVDDGSDERAAAERAIYAAQLGIDKASMAVPILEK